MVLRRFSNTALEAFLKVGGAFFLPFLVLAVLGLPALARAEDEALDIGLVKTSIKQEKLTAEVAEESQKRRQLKKFREVTYEMVMEDPTDLDLNFRYAKTQIAEGNFLGAAATLERILMIDEQADDVRLFYAIVLVRLDSLTEAKRELDLLSELDLPENIRREVKRYKKEIKQAQKSLKLTLRQSVGFGVDENKNAAPSSKRFLVFDGPFNTRGGDVQRKDTSFINVTSFEGVYDLGMQDEHEVFANVSYFRQEQTTLDSLDLESIQYELGGRLKTPWFHFIPSFRASHIFLSAESFLRTQGGNLRIEKQLTNRLDIYGNISGEWQDYLPVTESPTSPQRSGSEWTYKIGGDYALWKRMRVGTSVKLSNKNAKEEFNGSDKITINFNHMWFPGMGMFFINSLDGIWDNYDKVDTFIASRHRRDKILRYRLTYGVPLKTLFFGYDLPSLMGGATLSMTYEYYRSDSTITNNTYSNNTFQAFLGKTWNF